MTGIANFGHDSRLTTTGLTTVAAGSVTEWHTNLMSPSTASSARRQCLWLSAMWRVRPLAPAMGWVSPQMGHTTRLEAADSWLRRRVSAETQRTVSEMAELEPGEIRIGGIRARQNQKRAKSEQVRIGAGQNQSRAESGTAESESGAITGQRCCC